MKILNRAEFMKLPEGVLFSSGCQWAFDGFKVKGDTLATDDWIERELLAVECPQIGNSFGRPEYKDFFHTLDEMLTEGASYPVNTLYGRDGRFDADDVFLVFERADLLELQRVISKALEEG